jgi:ABC-type Mn2+/Zn2+ transport system ATPase subunit
MIKKVVLNFREYKIQNKDYEISFEIDPSLSLYPGDFIRIYGNNGTGKTAFFKTLAFYNVYDKPFDLIHSQSKKIFDSDFYIFYIPQNYEDFIYPGRTIGHFLFNYLNSKTIINNNDTKNIVTEFFENEKSTINQSLTIRDKKGKPIHNSNWADLLNYKMEMLSGGQKRFLYIIREFLALRSTEVKGFRILVLDEPFNDIDLSNIGFLKSLINQVRSQFPNLIILISTHLQLLENINRVFELIKAESSIKISEISDVNRKLELSKNRYN